MIRLPKWSGYMRALSMHIGTNPAPVAHVVPDDKWPNMWRVLWPDGKTSDMVNLTRAKDAATLIAAQTLSTPTKAFSRDRFRWEQTDHPRQKVQGAPR